MVFIWPQGGTVSQMSITTRHISDFIDGWAPNTTKLDYDNTGLLIGSPKRPVSRVLTCLDLTHHVADEAISGGYELIVAHHPTIFPKINRINASDATGSLIYKLIQNGIDVIAAHTNLDAARNGVSFELAKTLGLEKTRFLDNSYQTQKMVILRIPGRIFDRVDAFLNSHQTDTSWTKEENNIRAARFNFDTHFFRGFESGLTELLDGAPYSLDVLPNENPSSQLGFGAIGELPVPLSAHDFIRHVAKKLQTRGLRYSGNADTVSKVAVCGGSGSSLIRKAFASGAQAYVTADIKYHDFFVQDGCLLVDAGHYETEMPIIQKLSQEISKAFPSITADPTSVNTNPMYGFQLLDFTEKENT